LEQAKQEILICRRYALWIHRTKTCDLCCIWPHLILILSLL
jgi:hypothetical protein